MKKIFMSVMTLLLVTILLGCSDTITVPDFYGQDYGDVLSWAKDNDISINISSDYNDDVLPRSVFSQSIAAGEKMPLSSELDIVYSRGYNPNGEITVPDFSGQTISDISSWLSTNNITKYYFYDTFDRTIPKGEFVGYESTNTENRDTTLRKDTYFFYFSKGDLEIADVVFDNPSTARGVNLGGWFVLEGWMSPNLFSGVNGSDETAFMEQKPNAVVELENHWNTFITEDDFEYLSLHGIEYVRIPIPWWLDGASFEYTHENVTHNVQYANSLYYIERAMEWAETYNIKVLLDLHTAPGCQNGFDNGGITGVLQWPSSENVSLTVEVIDFIAEHFSSYDSLWGIEVLNEPGWGVNMGILQGYYVDAYEAIRNHNETVWVGFHDGFRNYDTTSWRNFFRDNDFENVFFDIHLYQTFGDTWGDFDIVDHVDFVNDAQYRTVHQYDGIVPIVIGEWSLGLQGNVFEGLNAEGTEEVRRAFGNAQLNVFEDAFGWFFWSYKIDRTSHLEWDMRRLIDNGTFPNYYKID